MLTSSLNTHWSTTVAYDMLQRFASCECSKSTEVSDIIERLGEALEHGHTALALDEATLSWFSEHTHPLVEVVTQQHSNRLNTQEASKAKYNDNFEPSSVLKPIVIMNGLAYFHRQWYQEFTLANAIRAMLTDTEQHVKPPNAALLPNELDTSALPTSMHKQQRAAIEAVLRNRLTLITGGPGTGKTWTVAQLVLRLLSHNPNLRIALAAPTGKAAQRMQDALFASLDKDASQALMAVVKSQLDQAKTIHRLIGLGNGQTPRFNALRPLDYDLIIIDEASMLGVALAGQLIQAVGQRSKLILLGDANQLAAVDAGAVLADLTCSEALKSCHVGLTQSTRFTADSSVGQLARAVLDNDVQSVDALLSDHSNSGHNHNHSGNRTNTDSANTDKANTDSTNTDKDNALTLISPSSGQIYAQLWQPFSNYTDAAAELYAKPKMQVQHAIAQLFRAFDHYRILSATHLGKLGVERINAELTKRHKAKLNLIDNGSPWFHGRPVMLTKNDYRLGLANGDVGIALIDDAGDFQMYFPSFDRPVAANRLSENHITTAFCMTIHKSQGSEFAKVAIVLDEPAATVKDKHQATQTLLSRELIYTAITRAKSNIALYASKHTLHEAMASQTTRQTGLATML